MDEFDLFVAKFAKDGLHFGGLHAGFVIVEDGVVGVVGFGEEIDVAAGEIRAEYRLLLREDNADLRLREKERSAGQVNDIDYFDFISKNEKIKNEFEILNSLIIYPNPDTNDRLQILGTSAIKKPMSLKELLRRPEISYPDLRLFYDGSDKVDSGVAEEVETQVKYAGYIQRQEEQVGRLRKLEGLKLPSDFDYKSIPGLTREIVEKLQKIRPLSLGQASRISGVTPAAISILMIYLKK